MIYLRAGLYAEGSTDYDFLLGLLDQLIPMIAQKELTGAFDVADARGIDAPGKRQRRDERIAAAIDMYWDECTLFVVHSDSDGDPVSSVKRERIEPGLASARAAHPDLAAAVCVPVRETEAWMLADAHAFCAVFETDRAPELPRDPEGVTDPKKLLDEVLQRMGARRERGSRAYYTLLGRAVRPAELRRLEAFRAFEEDLCAAVRALAGQSGGE